MEQQLLLQEVLVANAGGGGGGSINCNPGYSGAGGDGGGGSRWMLVLSRCKMGQQTLVVAEVVQQINLQEQAGGAAGGSGIVIIRYKFQ